MMSDESDAAEDGMEVSKVNKWRKFQCASHLQRMGDLRTPKKVFKLKIGGA